MSNRSEGINLTAISLVSAYLEAAFTGPRPGEFELELGDRDQAVVTLAQQQLPDMPMKDVAEVNRTLAHHGVAALALSLRTRNPADITDWLDRRITAMRQVDGQPVEIDGAELLRAFAPGLVSDGEFEQEAAASILARTDGTEMALYLAEFAARMYAFAFGSDGLERARAALGAFVGGRPD